MHYGIVVVTFGQYADPKYVVQLGQAAEAAVWESLFVWDHLAFTLGISSDNITMTPLPVQRPRVPIWIGGESAPALRRAARWDGWIAGVDDEQGNITKTPDELHEQMAVIHAQRLDSDLPFEIALMGQAFGKDQSMTSEYESAGATWWLEIIAPLFGPHEDMLERIHTGPSFE